MYFSSNSRLRRLVWSASVIASSSILGCATNRIDLVETRQIKAESTSTPTIVVPPPSVWHEDGATVVHGHIQRAAGAYTVGAGHTHVQIRQPGGKSSDEQRVAWSPKWIPFNGQRFSTYRAEFPGLAPADSNVCLWVCFNDHPEKPAGSIDTVRPEK